MGLTPIDEGERWFLEYVQKPNRGTTPQHAPFFAGDETTVSGWKVELLAAPEHCEPGTSTTTPPSTETRSPFEPLIEMMQIKGNSEVHRGSGLPVSSQASGTPAPSGTTGAGTSRRSASRTGCAGRHEGARR